MWISNAYHSFTQLLTGIQTVTLLPKTLLKQISQFH